MCTVVILRRPGHDWPLLLAVNRDEMLARPWKPPATHWPDRPYAVGGLDCLGGGTWLAINSRGVVACVLNRQGSLGPRPGYRSRGELPLEALDHADAATAAAALARIEPRSYRSFNLVIADAERAFCLSSRRGEDGAAAAQGIEVSELPPGLSMITAHDRNDRSSRRIARYLPKFQRARPPDPDAGDWESWQALLASRCHDPEAGPEGAMNVVTDTGFGTVSSSLIALPARQRVDVKPIWLDAPGRPGDVAYRPVAL